jgi:hypothetical protein
MHFRYTEEVNRIWSHRLIYLQFCLAWMFTAGLFQAAMVIMTHVNWENRNKWVPVTTAWGFLRLRIEERSPIWRVVANILNKQMRTADVWWSSNLVLGNCWHLLTVKSVFITKHEHVPWTWIDTDTNYAGENVTWDFVRKILWVCIRQVHLQQQRGN